MKNLIIIGDISVIGGIKGLSENINKIRSNYSKKTYYFNTNNYRRFLKISNLLSANFYHRFFYKFLVLVDVLKIIIFSNKSDILILSELNAPIGYYYNSIFKDVNFYIYIHGNYSTFLPRKYEIFLNSFKKAKYIFSVSEYSKKLFEERVKIKSKTKVINVGISPKDFFIEKNINKEEKIIFVGNITKKRKGFDFILDYIDKYKLNYELLIISNHEDNDLRVKKIISHLNIKNINFKIYKKISNDKLRFLYNKSKFNFACADIENSTGEYEGFNITLLEANACGTISIGSKNTANECAFKYSKGYLINYGNTLELHNVLSNKIDVSLIINNKIRTWDHFYSEVLNEIKLKS